MNMKTKKIIMIIVCILIPILTLFVGSAKMTPTELFQIIGNRLFDIELPSDFNESFVGIFWSIRLPRTVAGFLVGAMLGVSGALMQSVLQNPLASGYTLGVSSGTSLGAALVIVFEFSLPLVTVFTRPVVGFIFGFATVLLVLYLAMRLDLSLKNHTVILMGMVISLFVNSVLTLVSALHKNNIKELVIWQMGSLAGKRWVQVAIMAVVGIIVIVFVWGKSMELDILSFGDEQASSMGINIKKKKRQFLMLGTLLTATAISFTGIIGFIDLIAPHIIRRIFGSNHSTLIPFSALFGGAFMVFADTLARTILAPVELPVGAITAFVGAPFFAFVYFAKGKVAKS
jgi:iron complex transport system permease protein